MTAREERLSTRSEMKEAMHSLELKIDAVRADLKEDISFLRADLKGMEGKLTQWVFTCMLGQTAVIAGAVYFAITHLRP